MPFFFIYISDVWPFGRSDVLIAIGVSLFWLMGGYVASALPSFALFVQ